MSRSPKRKSVMQHQFSKAPQANISRSNFNRSYGHKTTLDGGLLIPIFVQEVLPGDSHTVRMDALARLATPIHPIMDNLRISSFFFFVPNRLTWANWQKFMGEQDNPGDSTDFTIPQIITTGGWTEGSLHDYFGVPTGIANLSVNALPIRSYIKIWNEWFRDQNLQPKLDENTDDGPDPAINTNPQRRGKRHDYFTSCLPWPQKGPGVDLPLGTTAPVVTSLTELTGAAEPLKWASAASGAPSVDGRNLGIASEGHTATYADSLSGADKVYPVNLVADLTDATASTINDLRQAFQIQKLQERDARGGTRYTEILKSHFQVTSPDARLQRPEYLGGGVSAVQIQTVPQTQSTSTDSGPNPTTPQAHLAGYGTATMSGHGFTKGFVEHGYIIGMISVQADLTYQQGLDRHWSRSTKYDFYWPALQAIGEQSVLNKEIYADNTANDNLVFGYQERFAEYRYAKSMITGEFRSNAAASLDPWHLSQDFGALPALNASFIEDNPPIDRVIAVPDEPHFLVDMYFNYNCARPMPTYGVPGYIDHF